MKHLHTLLLALFFQSSFAQLSWLQMATYTGSGAFGGASFEINGKGYYGLGLSGSNGYTDFYEYDPAGNSWTAKASLPDDGRWACATFVINGKGYVVGGSNGSTYEAELWEFDPVANTWTAKASVPGGRQSPVAFAIGNKGYAGTGYNGSSLDDFYEYDPVGDTWTAKANFPGSARNGAVGIGIGSKGYIGMGHSTNAVTYYNDWYEYDPSSNSWTQRANFPMPKINSATAYSSGTAGYVFGGYFYQYSGITHNPLNTLFKYDPQTNEWNLEGTCPGLPRGYAGGFALSNDIYVTCGAIDNSGSGSSLINDTWKLSGGLQLSVPYIGDDNALRLFPNPAGKMLYIEATDADITQLRMYDVKGSLLRTFTIANQREGVNVSALSAGLYFVEAITNKGEVIDTRFVKE